MPGLRRLPADPCRRRPLPAPTDPSAGPGRPTSTTSASRSPAPPPGPPSSTSTAATTPTRSRPGSGPDRQQETPAEYFDTFVDNPFPVQEWRYFLGEALVGIGYVDPLPVGLSAITFLYDPGHRDRSLGTWNVLALIDRAREHGLPHVYLGYYIADCRSMAYKARFLPNQTLDPDGKWRDFRVASGPL